MKRLVVLFLCVQIVTSCEENEDIQLKELPGTWIWTSSCGGFSGICSYPNNNNSKSIQITDDRFIQKTNGQITIDATYEIANMQTSDANYPYEKNYELKLGDGQILEMTFIQNKGIIYIENNYLLDSYKRK